MPSSAWSLGALSAGLVAAVLVAAPAPPLPRDAGPAAPPAAARWGWPLSPTPRVLRGHDEVGRYAAGHRGVDLAAAVGQPVLAVSTGSVTFAGPVAGRGVVVVAHADGTRTTYEPVVAAVAAGQVVQRSGVLGTVAAAPRHCVLTCLHLGLRRGEDYLDPLARLRGSAPVLLPLGRP